jgi:putative Flp pilus-assembly TadE/G-like protein
MRHSSGQIAVVVALALVVLLSFAALAMDVGYFQNDRRRMQSAADSAAMAGEREIVAGNSLSLTTAAQNDAQLNGFTNGTGSITVQVNNPPTRGSYAGDSSAVEVVITKPEPTHLLAVLGISTVNVSARAVAIETGSPDCIYALDSSAHDAVAFVGVSLFYSNCGIIDNSNDSEAMSFDIVSLIKAKSFGVVGDVGSFLISLVWPKPVTGIAPAPDPFASLTQPSVGPCDHFNYQVPLLGNATINPGVYCGGITSPLASVGTLTLNPGTYIIDGGGVQITGAALIKNNTTGGDGTGGVTFFLTGDSNYAYGGVNLTGVAINLLNAPTSGTYEGMLFMQDRTISSGVAAANPNTIIGVSLAKYQGVLYFPTTSLIYAGANLNAYTIIVADKIQFPLANVTDIYSDYSSLEHGNPIKTAALAE